MEKLAIDGGPRAVPEGYHYEKWPIITDRDIKSVVDVLKNKPIWGSNAPSVLEIERKWANYCGVEYCHGTNGGTAAIHMSLAGVGVKAGDEVIVPAYSFHSTASAILHHNAIPVFVDIDFDTYTIDWRKIDAAITDHTRAIIGVDLFGLPANWKEINRVASSNGLKTIEDACQSHGAEIDGKKTGTFADCGAFSLNGSKNLPGSEGGFFVTNNSAMFKNGIKLEMNVQTQEGKRVYPDYSFGWNYRMNPLAAALTTSQLDRLDELNAQRIKNCELLSERLSKLEGIIPPKVPDGFKHVYHMYKVALSEGLAEKYNMSLRELRDNLMFFLASEGVSISLWVQKLLPSLGIYQLKEGYGHGCPWTCPRASPRARNMEYQASNFPAAQKLIEGTFNINAIFTMSGSEHVMMVIKAFEKVWENLDKILD
ncbi:MAG: DegT/DnrJ/EryC1/StrS family aminotransferase [Promethearchaeota archaeon]